MDEMQDEKTLDIDRVNFLESLFEQFSSEDLVCLARENPNVPSDLTQSFIDNRCVYLIRENQGIHVCRFKHIRCLDIELITLQRYWENGSFDNVEILEIEVIASLF